jgi:hypothetical protein
MSAKKEDGEKADDSGDILSLGGLNNEDWRQLMSAADTAVERALTSMSVQNLAGLQHVQTRLGGGHGLRNTQKRASLHASSRWVAKND